MASSIPNSQRFLNSLDHNQTNDLLEAVYASGNYLDLVNRRHVSPSLDLDTFATTKSLREQTGQTLTKWMNCNIQEHHLNQPSPRHPYIALALNGIVWAQSVQNTFNSFCLLNNIEQLRIARHHIVLRASCSDRPLALFSITDDNYQGSHLCDTTGCLSPDHLCIEAMQVNRNRRSCEGIYVTIYKDATADEFLILQVDPCKHGLQHEQANGDFFKYSCRKIKATFITEDDLQ